MKIEIRENKIILDGYVNVVSRDSRVLPSSQGKFIEQIVPKTFERALGKSNNVDLLFNHKKDRKLGSIKDGNLELYEDSIGLRARCEISDEEVITRAKEGKLSGWSFGFISLKDKWEEVRDGVKRRFIEELELLEVSILDKTPAYIATSIEQRGEDSLIIELRNEDFNDVEIKENLDKKEDEILDEEEQEKSNEIEQSKEDIRNKIAIYEQELELLKIKAKN